MEKSKSDFSNVISTTKITIDQTLNVLQATQANPSEIDSLNSKISLLKVFFKLSNAKIFFMLPVCNCHFIVKRNRVVESEERFRCYQL